MRYNTTMNLDETLPLLARDPAAPLDLAEVALALACGEYPGLDVDAYLSELAGMAHEVRHRLRGGPEARVTALCRYLFHDMGFRGNTKEYYDARNSYLNEVIDRRTGLPIALSAVAMAVGGRAGLEVAGVGLPGHFIAKATVGGRAVLFDPFHGGRQLTPDDCEILVHQAAGLTVKATSRLLEAASLGQIVLRMLTNLKGVYLREGDFARAVRVIERLRQLAPDDPMQLRDLGASLIRAGEPGRAIGPLKAYLRASPSAGDREQVGQLIVQAKAEVAQWN
jgi:regulator of sirC expression with transglutaminase-like and TPR domain